MECGFHHITCVLPKYEWIGNRGFSEDEVKFLKDFVQKNAHLMI